MQLNRGSTFHTAQSIFLRRNHTNTHTHKNQAELSFPNQGHRHQKQHATFKRIRVLLPQAHKSTGRARQREEGLEMSYRHREVCMLDSVPEASGGLLSRGEMDPI